MWGSFVWWRDTVEIDKQAFVAWYRKAIRGAIDAWWAFLAGEVQQAGLEDAVHQEVEAAQLWWGLEAFQIAAEHGARLRDHIARLQQWQAVQRRQAGKAESEPELGA